MPFAPLKPPSIFFLTSKSEPSHNLVTIPPAGWIDVAHRHGTRVLGTFITEWDKGYDVCESGKVVDRFVRGLGRSAEGSVYTLPASSYFDSATGWSTRNGCYALLTDIDAVRERNTRNRQTDFFSTSNQNFERL